MIGERNVGDQERKDFAVRTARVISLAANQFNLGLRSYYFGLAMLAWFINPWFFMLITAGVVLVLYRREFHSAVLEVMVYTPTTQAAEPPKEKTNEYSVLVRVLRCPADLHRQDSRGQGHEGGGRRLRQSPPPGPAIPPDRLRRSCAGAHLNSIEIFPLFAAGVLMAHTTDTRGWLIDLLALVFIVSRVIYLFLYWNDIHLLRSLVWVVGLVCCLLLMLSPVL